MNINIYNHIASIAGSLTLGVILGLAVEAGGGDPWACLGLAIVASMSCYPFMLGMETNSGSELNDEYFNRKS